jgi:hypothetical protein
MTPRAIKRRERERVASRCLGCQAETSSIPLGKNAVYYMVHNHIWLKANPAGTGKLCIGCLENHIGQRLVPSDYTDWPLNNFPRGSQRLVSTLTGHGED